MNLIKNHFLNLIIDFKTCIRDTKFTKQVNVV